MKARRIFYRAIFKINYRGKTEEDFGGNPYLGTMATMPLSGTNGDV
jgi:hypothetical protein